MVGKIRPRKIIMPSDLTGTGRRRRLSGPVITYHMSHLMSDPLPRSVRNTLKGVKDGMVKADNFTSMDTAEQQAVLLELVREGKSDVEIGDMLDMSQWQIRNLRYKLGIKKDRGGNVYLREPEIDLEAHGAQVGAARRLLAPDDGDAAPAPKSGLQVSWSGNYRAEELASRLDGLQGLMRTDLDNRLYRVRVEIWER